MRSLSVAIIIFLPSAFAFQPVDVNHASAEQIALLPSVGKRLAENVVAQRKRAPFTSINDLASVPGMTARKLQQLKEHVIFTARSKKIVQKKSEVNDKTSPLSTKPIMEFGQLEKLAIEAQGLGDDIDRSLANRVRKSAWLPKLSTYINTDHGEVATQKAASDPISTRGGRDLGFGIRARFDLDKLIFNNDELEVAKLSLSRHKKRAEVSETLRKHYFRYVQLAGESVGDHDLERRHKLSLELAEVAAALDSLSGGNFGRADVQPGAGS